MTGDRIDELWVPRIGAHATQALRRYRSLTLAIWPTILVVAFLSGFAVASSNSAVVALAIVGVGLTIRSATIWWQSSRKLAAAISEWYGQPIKWQELPRMHPEPYDRWCRVRNLKPPEGCH